jgi:hypothetical protein
MFFLFWQEPNSVNNTLDITKYFTLIAPMVVILTFIANAFITYKLRKSEVKRNWYLKVLIEPNLKILNQFYIDTVDLLNKSCEDLLKKKAIGHNEFIELKATKNGEFQELKRVYEFDFVDLISVSKKDIQTKLSESLRNLEDLYTNFIDQNINQNFLQFYLNH